MFSLSGSNIQMKFLQGSPHSQEVKGVNEMGTLHLFPSAEPVSYTHLDVYKRQVITVCDLKVTCLSFY